MSPRRFPFFGRRRAAAASDLEGCAGLPCRELVELVTAYLEDALPADDRARFEIHVSNCANCAAYVEQMRVTLRVVGHLDPGGLDPRVEQELMAAFKDYKKETGPR